MWLKYLTIWIMIASGWSFTLSAKYLSQFPLASAAGIMWSRHLASEMVWSMSVRMIMGLFNLVRAGDRSGVAVSVGVALRQLGHVVLDHRSPVEVGHDAEHGEVVENVAHLLLDLGKVE